MMRAMSDHTDPQKMVLEYSKHIQQIMPTDQLVAISRRDIDPPKYRITRSSTWGLERNPWKEVNSLPVLESGILGELIYSDQPRLINNFNSDPDDPAFEFLDQMRSLIAIPVYDQGVALNMVIMMRRQPDAFDPNQLPDQVWTTNLFGRATQTLVLSDKINQAYEIVDEEMKTIGDLQRSLLPKQLPNIPSMQLAVHYQPATRSGGDYYDFFPMANGAWGIIIADVSGHGSPAAVLMAVTHTLAHTNSMTSITPSQMLEYVNHHLATKYTADTGKFVTAFFGAYDPATRKLTYARAGHNPPRVKRCQDGSLFSLDGVGDPPLGIIKDQTYDQTTVTLETGDQIVFYTDGITEAFNRNHKMFGEDRLDTVLHNCMIDAAGLIDAVLEGLATFTDGHPPDDDRTILVAKIT